MGVGAAMAAGSHAENGNWALLEILAVNNNNITIELNELDSNVFQFIDDIIIAMEIRMAISPKRLDKIVMVPDLDDDQF